MITETQGRAGSYGCARFGVRNLMSAVVTPSRQVVWPCRGGSDRKSDPTSY